MLLAQVDPTKAIADGLGANFLPYACALLVLFVGVLLRAYLAQAAEHKAELARRDVALATANTERLADMKTDAKEQREILSQIVPLAAKLTEGLEILERLTLTKE